MGQCWWRQQKAFIDTFSDRFNTCWLEAVYEPHALPSHLIRIYTLNRYLFWSAKLKGLTFLESSFIRNSGVLIQKWPSKFLLFFFFFFLRYPPPRVPPSPPPPPLLWDDINEHKYQCSLNTMDTCRHIYMCVCVCVCVYGWCHEPERGGKVHSSVVGIFFFFFFLSETSINTISRVASRTQLWRKIKQNKQ